MRSMQLFVPVGVGCACCVSLFRGFVHRAAIIPERHTWGQVLEAVRRHTSPTMPAINRCVLSACPPQDLHNKAAAADTDSDSSSDSDAEDEETPAKANGTAPRPAKSPSAAAAAAGGSSDSGEESEGLDDEAMLRMDAALAAAVRASLSRGGGSAKERAAALLALQLRVAALLEDWLKKVSSPDHKGSKLVVVIHSPVSKVPVKLPKCW